jgi:hypothetical protein
MATKRIFDFNFTMKWKDQLLRDGLNVVIFHGPLLFG